MKELLYIDNYWKKEFKAQYEKETRNSPNYTDMLPFANNSRTICIAFVMLASRYYSGNLDANDINTIYNGKKSDSAKNEYNEVCEKLEGVDSGMSDGHAHLSVPTQTRIVRIGTITRKIKMPMIRFFTICF